MPRLIFRPAYTRVYTVFRFFFVVLIFFFYFFLTSFSKCFKKFCITNTITNRPKAHRYNRTIFSIAHFKFGRFHRQFNIRCLFLWLDDHIYLCDNTIIIKTLDLILIHKQFCKKSPIYNGLCLPEKDKLISDMNIQRTVQRQR